MSMDNILELVEQYKEAAQLIEAAQAEQEIIIASPNLRRRKVERMLSR